MEPQLGVGSSGAVWVATLILFPDLPARHRSRHYRGSSKHSRMSLLL